MSLGLNAEERERLSYIKNNSDYIDFHYIPIWLECDTDEPLIQSVNTLLILLRLDMLYLLKKQRDDYFIDEVFDRRAFSYDYNEFDLTFMRFKWSIERTISRNRISTKILDEGLRDQWLAAYQAKTDCVQAAKSKQNYMNNIDGVRRLKVSFYAQDKNRIYLPYQMFDSLYKREQTQNESCIDSYNDNEYQRCKSYRPDFILISRLFFDSNFKVEKLVQ